MTHLSSFKFAKLIEPEDTFTEIVIEGSTHLVVQLKKSDLITQLYKSPYDTVHFTSDGKTITIHKIDE